MPKEQLKMDNAEKLATQDKEKTKQKSTTQHVPDIATWRQIQTTKTIHEPSYKQLEEKTTNRATIIR